MCLQGYLHILNVPIFLLFFPYFTTIIFLCELENLFLQNDSGKCLVIFLDKIFVFLFVCFVLCMRARACVCVCFHFNQFLSERFWDINYNQCCINLTTNSKHFILPNINSVYIFPFYQLHVTPNLYEFLHSIYFI